jgi:hypothetical protein
MFVNGPFGDLKYFADLPSRLPVGHPAENLALARRQFGPGRLSSAQYRPLEMKSASSPLDAYKQTDRAICSILHSLCGKFPTGVIVTGIASTLQMRLRKLGFFAQR